MLSAAEKNSLLKNRVFLISSVYPSEEFYSHMMADRSLTDTMVEEIKVSLHFELILFSHLALLFFVNL